VRRLRSEDGFAVPIAIWMLVLGLLFGGLAMGQALLGLRTATTSLSSTRANAAAEAGMRMAVYTINTLGLNGASLTHLTSTLDWTQCAAQASSDGTIGAPGASFVTSTAIGAGKAWCDPVQVDLGGGATATYQVSSIINCNADLDMNYNPLPTVLTLGQTIRDCLRRKIVSVGTVDGVSRRVYEEVRATGSASVIAGILPGVNILGSVTLQAAQPTPGTLRECPPAGATASNPATGC
jgi:hypothetical protein